MQGQNLIRRQLCNEPKIFLAAPAQVTYFGSNEFTGGKGLISLFQATFLSLYSFSYSLKLEYAPNFGMSYL